MAKAPFITVGDRLTIAEIYYANPAAKTREIFQKVNERMGRMIALSTVQRELKAIRELDQVISTIKTELNRTWHVGTLEKYPIPAEVIPLLLEIQSRNGKAILPVGTAIWISRLYKLLKPEDNIADLIYVASYLTTYTITRRLVGLEEPDTSEFDDVSISRMRANMERHAAKFFGQLSSTRGE